MLEANKGALKKPFLYTNFLNPTMNKTVPHTYFKKKSLAYTRFVMLTRFGMNFVVFREQCKITSNQEPKV